MTIYVVMYVTTAEGTEYYYVGASSYNDVKDAYADNGTTADGNEVEVSATDWWDLLA